MENPVDRMWTKSRIIRERRWTESLVKRFLGNPDATRPNPNYRSAAPMKLYQLGRVFEAESTDEFHEALTRANKRRRSALAVAQAKREELIDWAYSLPEPKLPGLSKENLSALAVDHYNDLWNWKRGNFDKSASVADDRDFLNRISVNYIRHELTDYEGRILEMRGKIGKNEALQTVRTKILHAIANRFGWLADECARQQNLNSGEL